MKYASIRNLDQLRIDSAVGKLNKKFIPKQSRLFSMPKLNVSPQYAQKLKEFKDTLSEQQILGLSDSPRAKDKIIAVMHEDGRKFDKIKVAIFNDSDSKSSKPEVRFFIDRADGTIYGAKSPVAPRLEWYFGTIYETELWNWQGYHPVPLDPEKAGVKKVAEYNGKHTYITYEKVKPDKKSV